MSLCWAYLSHLTLLCDHSTKVKLMRLLGIGNSFHWSSLNWVLPRKEETAIRELLHESRVHEESNFNLKLVAKCRAKEREYVKCIWASAEEWWAKDTGPKNELADRKEMKPEIEQCNKE